MKRIFLLLLISTLAAAAHSQINSAGANQTAGNVKAAAAAVDSTSPKLYILQGTVEAYQALIQALEQSTASHLQVEALKQWILPAIEKQLAKGASK